MNTLRRIFTFFTVVAYALSVMALDLPVKTLNGTKYYYYKVKKNESVYGLSKKLGMSRDEIVRHNPAADDGIKKGMTLYFPYDEYATKSEPKAAVEEPIDTVAVDTAFDKSSSIVLMLPFGLENKEQSRRNKLALDFYKGFLMAADTLASRNGLVEIHAIDIDVENSRFDAILHDEAVTNASVIVAPDNGAAYRKIAKTARENGNYVLNVFLVADSLYTENPNVLQANIPHLDMYRLAVDAFESDFKDYTPVILRNRTGRNEKEAFVSYFMERCSQRGIVPIEISYENNLVSADLKNLATNAGQRYVFVPSSGSMTEFNKFAYVIKAIRDRATASGNDVSGAEFELFGYPDWTAYRGEALDTLHKLGATVYSRFFDDFNSFDSRTLQSNFRRWYGHSIIESIPSQAVLGYDTGCFLIKNLRANDGAFDPVSPRSYSGLQSTFDFDKSEQGYYNSTLYIIKYHTDGTMTSRTL